MLTVNIGVARPDLVNSPFLMDQFLDNEPLTGGRDANPEISFEYGFSASHVAATQDDMILAGDFSGLGFDQVVAVRPFAGALQWLGDTDRDTDQEYLFRFGLSDFTPLIADMNGDGIDDAIAVDTTTVSGLNEWYIHYGVPGANPFPTDDSTVGVDATFSFGLNATHVPRVGDISGDGRADAISVDDDGTNFDWYISNAAAGATPYPNNTPTVLSISTTINDYGANNDVPVVGDWDNDGDDNIGVVDENTTPSTWNLDTNGGGAAEISLQYGLAGDQYLVGNWADVLWDGSSDNNWNTAANWSGGVVPSAGQNVVIDQPALAVTVTAPSTTTIGSLTSTEALTTTGGLFSFSEASRVDGGLTVDNGSGLSIGANLTADISIVDAGSVITLSGNNLIDGTLTITAGGFNVSGRSLDNPVIIGGDFSQIGVGNLTFSGPVTLNTTPIITTAFSNSAVTFSGVIDDGPETYGLTVSGSGTTTLSGANTFSGVITVSGGTLSLGASGVISDSSLVDVGSGATFDLNNFDEQVLLVKGDGNVNLGSGNLTVAFNGQDAFSGIISGTGDVTKDSGGTWILSGANTYSGQTTIAGGILRLGNAAALGTTAGNTTVVSGATLDLNGTIIAENLVLNGAGAGGAGALISSTGGSLPLTGTIALASDTTINTTGSVIGLDGVVSGSGNLTKEGNSFLTITNSSNTFTGTVTLAEGVLSIEANSLGSTAGSTIVNAGTDLRLLSGNYTAAEPFVFNGGTVSSNTTASISAPITLNNDIDIWVDFPLTLSGTITGIGGIRTIASGDVIINGVNTYTGTTLIDAGTLKGSGTITGPVEISSGGSVAPGNSPGILNTGDFDLQAGATLQVEVGGFGASPGLDYDQVNVTGTVNLAGTLDTVLYSNISLGEAYTIINNDGLDAVSGTFTGLAEGATIAIGSGTFTISYIGGDGNDVVLAATTTTTFDAFWEGTGGNANFSNPLNWRGGIVPGLTDDVLVDTAANGTIVIDGAITVNSIEAHDPVQFNADVTTVAGQFYGQSSVLTSDITLDGTSITFDGTVDGAFALTVNSSGLTTFNSAVGGITPLTTVTTNASGETRFGADITTTTNQAYNDATTLTADVVMTSGSGSVFFGNRINALAAGAQSLTINGDVWFNNDVGNSAELKSLSVTGATETNTNFRVINTLGAQTYTGPFVATQQRTLTSSGGGNITFSSTVDAPTNGLAEFFVNTSGVTTFGGDVGATRLLGSLTTDAAGSTVFGGSPRRSQLDSSFIERGALCIKKLRQSPVVVLHPWTAHFEEEPAPKPARKKRPDGMKLARHYQALLDSGKFESRAALARHLDVSRARVTQVLARLKE